MAQDNATPTLAASASDHEKEAHHLPPSTLDITSKAGDDEHTGDDGDARLHGKTVLAVLAVCLIYFAQLINLVGAGAVSHCLPLPPAKQLVHTNSLVCSKDKALPGISTPKITSYGFPRPLQY